MANGFRKGGLFKSTEAQTIPFQENENCISNMHFNIGEDEWASVIQDSLTYQDFCTY